MLLLLFQIGKDRFGLDVSQIIKVVPLVILKKVHRAPNYIAGLFDYRGTIIPVIDLSALISGKPSRLLLSTRIILVDFINSDNNHHILGLMTERVSETIMVNEKDFKQPIVESETIRYLGDIIPDENGMIKRIKIENILPEYLQKLLFKTKKEV